LIAGYINSLNAPHGITGGEGEKTEEGRAQQ